MIETINNQLHRDTDCIAARLENAKIKLKNVYFIKLENFNNNRSNLCWYEVNKNWIKSRRNNY